MVFVRTAKTEVISTFLVENFQKNVTNDPNEKLFLARKALQKLIAWKEAPRRSALCVVGARQIGKTTLIRHFARQYYEHFVEINFVTEPKAKAVFAGSLNANAIVAALSAYLRRPLVPGKTLIFLDEIQDCPQARAAIKFLVEDGRFDYIESGSLLGVKTNAVPSFPVGFETPLTMYPLDFSEFCMACGLQPETFDYLKTCFETLQPVAETVHNSMMQLLYAYMVVGGMPQCVCTYIATHDIGQILAIQNDILALYRLDIARYADRDKEKIREIFDVIPSQLEAKNRRFVLSDIAKSARLLRYENSFVWLSDAGVALPCFNVTQPTSPLGLSEISLSFSCATRVCLPQQACRTFSSIFCKATSKSILVAYWRICLRNNCMPTALHCVTTTPNAWEKLISSSKTDETSLR